MHDHTSRTDITMAIIILSTAPRPRSAHLSISGTFRCFVFNRLNIFI